MLMVNRMKEGIKKTYIYIWYNNIRMYCLIDNDCDEQIIKNKLEEYLNWMCQLSSQQLNKLIPKLFERHKRNESLGGYTVHGCAVDEMNYIDFLKNFKKRFNGGTRVDECIIHVTIYTFNPVFCYCSR